MQLVEYAEDVVFGRGPASLPLDRLAMPRFSHARRHVWLTIHRDLTIWALTSEAVEASRAVILE
jgi:hypothetical protein